VLRRSIAATGKTTGECLKPTGACLTYAYALFDLGEAQLRSGDTAGAVATLSDRLRIDNQRGIVAAELAKARGGGSASSGSSSSGAAPAPKKAGKKSGGG
jgi:hypothetical protein